MANIIVSHKERDPFEQSDRDPWHPHAGKGDRDRTKSEAFKRGYDEINWGPSEARKPGKTTKRYGSLKRGPVTVRIVMKSKRKLV